jgi:enterochelin esterase-like enzyme
VVVQHAGRRRTVRVTPASVVTFDLSTPALGGFSDPVYVVLPPGYAQERSVRFPTFYLLHGQPGEPQNFLNIGDVQGVEATLVAEKRMKPMILVMPTGSPGFLTDTEWANGTGHGNEWLTFVASDLVPAIDSRFRAIPEGQARVIGGFSEGAYGALNIALHNVGEFDTIQSWSGYMQALNMPTIFGTGTEGRLDNSPYNEVQTEAASLRSTGTYFWMYTGTQEPSAHRQTLLFSTELARLGVPYLYLRAPGTHDWALWRSMVAQSLLEASDRVSGG